MNTHYSITPLKPGNHLLFADTLADACAKALANTQGAVIHDAGDNVRYLYFEGQVYQMVAVDVEAEVTK